MARTLSPGAVYLGQGLLQIFGHLFVPLLLPQGEPSRKWVCWNKGVRGGEKRETAPIPFSVSSVPPAQLARPLCIQAGLALHIDRWLSPVSRSQLDCFRKTSRPQAKELARVPQLVAALTQAPVCLRTEPRLLATSLHASLLPVSPSRPGRKTRPLSGPQFPPVGWATSRFLEDWQRGRRRGRGRRQGKEWVRR